MEFEWVTKIVGGCDRRPPLSNVRSSVRGHIQSRERLESGRRVVLIDIVSGRGRPFHGRGKMDAGNPRQKSYEDLRANPHAAAVGERRFGPGTAVAANLRSHRRTTRDKIRLAALGIQL